MERSFEPVRRILAAVADGSLAFSVLHPSIDILALFGLSWDTLFGFSGTCSITNTLKADFSPKRLLELHCLLRFGLAIMPI